MIALGQHRNARQKDGRFEDTLRAYERDLFALKHVTCNFDPVLRTWNSKPVTIFIRAFPLRCETLSGRAAPGFAIATATPNNSVAGSLRSPPYASLTQRLVNLDPTVNLDSLPRPQFIGEGEPPGIYPAIFWRDVPNAKTENLGSTAKLRSLLRAQRSTSTRSFYESTIRRIVDRPSEGRSDLGLCYLPKVGRVPLLH